jgi:hypothetical protein
MPSPEHVNDIQSNSGIVLKDSTLEGKPVLVKYPDDIHVIKLEGM